MLVERRLNVIFRLVLNRIFTLELSFQKGLSRMSIKSSKNIYIEKKIFVIPNYRIQNN